MERQRRPGRPDRQGDLFHPAWTPLQLVQNEAEADFQVLADRNGWYPSKRGWPDFLCWKDDQVIAVEVKPRTKSGRLVRLKWEQAKVLQVLKDHGIRCYVSDGKVLEPFDWDKHYVCQPTTLTSLTQPRCEAQTA